VNAFKTIVEAIPAELTDRKQWVCWRSIVKKDGPTKIPFQVDGIAASSTDPQTWTTFETATESVHKFDGLGFTFSSTDDFIGIDLDACRDPETGTLEPWAVEVVQWFATYTEVSPSQTGVKLFAKSKHEWNHRKKIKLDGDGYNGKSPGIEVYQAGRYFTVTGQLVGDVCEVRYCDDSLEWLADRFKMRREQPIASEQRPEQTATPIIERASKYLATLEPSISGQDGSGKLFYAACRLVKGFELSDSDAMRLLTNEFNPRCQPPWSERELRHKVEDARKTSEPSGYLLEVRKVGEQNCSSTSPANKKPKRASNGGALLAAENRTDAGNARRFIDAFHDELLYVAPWKKFLAWDGKRWHEDSGVGVNQRAKDYSDSLWEDFVGAAKVLDGEDAKNKLNSLRSFVAKSNGSHGIESYLKLAAYDERVVCQVDALNADPYLLNCSNGTIDLRTGKLRPHSPSDRITQLAPVDYYQDADCLKWLDTMDLVFDGNAELIRYVQQLLGYSLTGDTSQHILPIAWGSGCNGKSTIWGTVTELLGDYSTLANDDLLLGDKSNHPTEKAALYQKRFVAISEPEKNASLREARVKELTGDRTITARRMHEDFWSFQRTFTFWLSTNHLPRIDGTDEGIWRRVKLIPFTVDIRTKTKPIPDLDRWLVANEGPGILAWLVRGYIDYRTNGLVEPSVVTQATSVYRADSDPLGDFIQDCCITGKYEEETSQKLYEAYQEHGGKWSVSAFGRALAERYEKAKSKLGKNRDKVVYKGIRLRTFDDTPQMPENSKNPGENAVGTTWDHLKVLSTENGPFPRANVLTSPNPSQSCEKCGSKMVRSEVDTGDGWRNYDCPKCGFVKPVCEVAK
jgi:putative DNA primase/helicase